MSYHKKKFRSESESNTYIDESYTFRIDSSWDNEIKHFFDAIEKDKKISLGNTTDALNLMKHIDKIYKSDNRPLKDALNLNKENKVIY